MPLCSNQHIRHNPALQHSSNNRFEYFVPKLCPPAKACGIGLVKWVVAHVAVAVVALQVAGVLYVGVCAQETADERVVEAAVHVDDAHVLQMLVRGLQDLLHGG